MKKEHESEMKLQDLYISPNREDNIRVFASIQKAMEHICDHLLTRPESHYWAVVSCEYQGLIDDPTSEDQLEKIAWFMWNVGPSEETQELYDCYAIAIKYGIRSGIQNSWCFRRGKDWHGLGLNGVYSIWTDSHVKTAMLKPYAAVPGETGSRMDVPRPRHWTGAKRLLNCVPASKPENHYRQVFFKTYMELRNLNWVLSTSRFKISAAPSLSEWQDLISSSCDAVGANDE